MVLQVKTIPIHNLLSFSDIQRTIKRLLLLNYFYIRPLFFLCASGYLTVATMYSERVPMRNFGPQMPMPELTQYCVLPLVSGPKASS